MQNGLDKSGRLLDCRALLPNNRKENTKKRSFWVFSALQTPIDL